LLAKQISLMAADREAVTDRVYRRYPFFRSTYFERRMLFDRQLRMPPRSSRGRRRCFRWTPTGRRNSPPIDSDPARAVGAVQPPRRRS
jgi:hypothetical protein